MESACDICGCTQTNLVDGFYYCAECGTQDTNVRETIVELVTLGDGNFGYGKRKRIRQLPQANEQMSDDWYKWHGMNFLLQGLANDLVDLGAAPSFKTKLLWVWTRYMQKYQNRADFGLLPDDENADNGDKIDDVQQEIEDKENLALGEDDFSADDEDLEECTNKKKRQYTQALVNIKRITISLVIALLYVALNLDKSHIQLTNLIRFIIEDRLPVYHWQKYVPNELRPKKMLCYLFLNQRAVKYSYRTTLKLSFQLFKELDLGNPIVPDLRMLVDQYMKELCLPHDLKPLILSLMQHRSFDYLDVNVKFYEGGRVPAYELYVMSHILCALKICFGIDGVYEDKLSDAVEIINEMENHPKSYNSEPTERLFSFREWTNYLQFRKSMLWSHSLYLGTPNYCDMDDYVAFEHMNEKPDFKKTFKDEIARDIINKLPDVEINVIPKSEFPATTTPHTTYTRVIRDHQQDPTIKQLLDEDFTQYSLKYVTEDMFLVDPESVNPKNIIGTLNGDHIKETGSNLNRLQKFANELFNKRMVYVKDCDNHNWMITQKPLIENFEKICKKDDKTNDGENNPDSKDDSIATNVFNEVNSVTVSKDDSIATNVIDEVSSVTVSKEASVITEDSKLYLDSVIEMEKDKTKQESEDLGIPEEAENCNIFDDSFEDLDTKKEEKEEHSEPEYNEPDQPMPERPEFSEIFNAPDIYTRSDLYNQEYRTTRDSDESSRDSIHFNPETLDRQQVIKELVIHACNKYRLSLPGQYIYKSKKISTRRAQNPNPDRPSVHGSTKLKIKGLIADYQNHVQNDIFVKMSSMVQSAITDYNKSIELETPMEIDEPAIDVNDNIESPHLNGNEQDNIQTLNDTTLAPELNNKTSDDGKSKLFGEDSDGETQAEELLPKKNPAFDEATHDITQLYIDPPDDPVIPEISLGADLFEIIDKEIKEEEEAKEIFGPKEESDSEEEMSLSTVRELKLLREKMRLQANKTKNRRYGPLITNPVPPYNFWMTHYITLVDAQLSNKRFATEIDDCFPASFKVVISECADVVGYPVKFLYRGLQRVETCIKDKYIRKKRFDSIYFEKEKRRFAINQNIL